MTRRLLAHWPLVVLLTLNVALAVAFSVVSPLYEPTDELVHYRYVRYILATGQLPVLDPNQPRIPAQHTPLYYLLGAASTFWIQPDSSWNYEPVWNPYWGFHSWEVGVDNKNHYLHGSEEAFPWSGTPLGAHVARWVNVILGALTVAVTFAIAKRTFRGSARDALAYGAAAIVAFNPQFLYLSAAVNNDIGAGLAGAVLVLALVDQVGRPLTIRRAIFLGLLFGLAFNFKTHLAFMLIVIELAFVLASWRERQWRGWVAANLVFLTVTLALTGWYFVRNQILYGDPTALRRVNEIWGGGRDPLHSWGAALTELPYAWSSLWGRFGYGQIPMPAWIYTAILIMMGVAAAGLGIAQVRYILHRRDAEKTLDLCDLSVFAVLIIFATVVVFAGVLWGYMLISTAGPMGRFFFPALPALAILMTLGLSQFVSERHQFALAATVAIAMLTLALYSLFGVLAPAYSRPAPLTPQQIAAIPHGLDVTFENKAKLLGYAVDTDTLRPGGQMAVTLYWQALAPMNENYAVFVHLVNPSGALSAQRDTFPGLGNFPTSQWKPGDIFADTYRMDIGETAYAPDTTELRVGLYLPDGPRLAAFGADGQSLGDGVALAPIKIVPRPGAYPNSVRVNFGGKLALLGYDVNTRAVRPGETISATLTWQALAPMKYDYSVFMHLASVSSGDVVVKDDSFPYTSPKRTRRWSPGQVMTEVRPLQVPVDAQPGLYNIEMGVLSVDLNEQLPIIAPDGHYVNEEMTLVQVRVEGK